MKRFRFAVLTLVCCLGWLGPPPVTATTFLGPYSFDDGAFADKAVQLEGGAVSYYGASSLDEALTGFTPNAGIVNVGYEGDANLFQLEFLDLMAANGAGADLLFVDARFSCNAYAVAVRQFGGSYSEFIDYPAGMFVNTQVIGVGGATLYGLPLDLGAFGFPPGALVDAIRFRALPNAHGVTEGDPVMAGVLKGHTVTVADTGFSPLPDTGRHGCTCATHGIPCPSPGEPFYGQDANYQGREPSYRDNQDGTVIDLGRGVIWQKPASRSTFSGTWAEAEEYCGALELAGRADWRLPSRMELLTILLLGLRSPPVRVMFLDPYHGAYWTGSKDASDPERRWTVGFGWGDAFPARTTGLSNAVCVSGAGPPPPGEYVDNLDGSIWDITTGLVWQQADDGTLRNWEEALSYCQALTLGGYDDWWLPNALELSALVDERRMHPALSPLFESSGPTWTASTSLMNGDEAYVVGLDSAGHLGYRNKDIPFQNAYTRCVRHPALTPKLRFTPVEDATITSSSPTKNYGAVKELEVDGSPQKGALIKFSVAGIGAREVANATLRLYCSDASDHGGEFHGAENGWSEQTVTWQTAPPFDPTAIASLGPVALNSWVSVDLTPLISGDGLYSLMVTSSAKEGADYRAREKTGYAPQLVVTVK